MFTEALPDVEAEDRTGKLQNGQPREQTEEGTADGSVLAHFPWKAAAASCLGVCKLCDLHESPQLPMTHNEG